MFWHNGLSSGVFPLWVTLIPIFPSENYSLRFCNPVNRENSWYRGYEISRSYYHNFLLNMTKLLSWIFFVVLVCRTNNLTIFSCFTLFVRNDDSNFSNFRELIKCWRGCKGSQTKYIYFIMGFFISRWCFLSEVG